MGTSASVLRATSSGRRSVLISSRKTRSLGSVGVARRARSASMARLRVMVSAQLGTGPRRGSYITACRKIRMKALGRRPRRRRHRQRQPEQALLVAPDKDDTSPVITYGNARKQRLVGSAVAIPAPKPSHHSGTAQSPKEIRSLGEPVAAVFAGGLANRARAAGGPSLAAPRAAPRSRAHRRHRSGPPRPLPHRLPDGADHRLAVPAPNHFAFGLAALVVVTSSRLVSAAAAGFAASTLGGYVLSLWVGLFGFKEVRTTAGVVAGLIEVSAFAVLGLLAVAPSPRRPGPGPCSPPAPLQAPARSRRAP